MIYVVIHVVFLTFILTSTSLDYFKIENLFVFDLSIDSENFMLNLRCRVLGQFMRIYIFWS